MARLDVQTLHHSGGKALDAPPSSTSAGSTLRTDVRPGSVARTMHTPYAGGRRSPSLANTGSVLASASEPTWELEREPVAISSVDTLYLRRASSPPRHSRNPWRTVRSHTSRPATTALPTRGPRQTGQEPHSDTRTPGDPTYPRTEPRPALA